MPRFKKSQFMNLNIPWNPSNPSEIAELSLKMNYATIAFNVNCLKVDNDLNLSQMHFIPPEIDHLQCLSRITFQINNLNELNVLKKKMDRFESKPDIIAVSTVDEKVFRHCCEDAFFDIITLPLGQKLPFFFPRTALSLAIRNKVFLEVCYAPFIEDESTRSHFLKNLHDLIDLTKGKNLIFSSGSCDLMLQRSPSDVMNLCALFSVQQEFCRGVVVENCLGVLQRRKSRKSYREVISVTTVEESGGRKDLSENWKRAKICNLETGAN